MRRLARFPHSARFPTAALLCMALLFGVVCVLPNIWQRMDAEYPFRGIDALGADQEHFYATRIRDVMDGHWRLGDPYHADKQLPSLQPVLPEWIMGSMAIVFGLKIGPAVIVAKILFGALLFLTMALFWTRMTGRPWAALLATSAVLFSWFLFAAPWVLLDALQGLPLGADFARFSRLTNPQFSGALFFLALLAGADWYQSNRCRSILIAGAVTGVSFYAYPYTWSYLLVTFGLLFIAYIVRKEWQRVRDVALGGVVAGVLALPSLVHMAGVAAHPEYPALVQRFGLIASRAPVTGMWAFLFVVIACIGAKRLTRAPGLLLALAAGSLIVLNQQVLTGTVIVPHHYHWYFIHPLAVATFVLALCALAAPYLRRLGPVVLGMLLAASVAWGIRYQWHAYQAQQQIWGEMQKAAGVFAFLDTLHEPTVYADDLVGSLIPVYTHANVSFAGAANVACLCSFELIRDSYFLELWLKGVTAEEAAATFPTTARESVSAKLYGLYYRESAGSYASIPDDKVQEAVDAYQAYAAAPVAEKLRRSPTDVYVRKTGVPENPHVRELLRSASLVYDDGNFEAWDIGANLQ